MILIPSNSSVKDIYQGYIQSEGGKTLADKSKLSYWVGKDDYLDNVMSINPETYALRYVSGVQGKEFCVIADISSMAIREALDDLTLGDNSIIATNQVNSVEELNQLSNELERNATSLQDAIKLFVLDESSNT